MRTVQPIVYAWVNVKNGKLYVGSTVHPKSRKAQHLCSLRKNKSSLKILQAAWNKHGEEAFRWVILAFVGREDELRAVEKRWIDRLDATRTGYNVSNDTRAPARHARYSKEERRRRSERMKGKRLTLGVKYSDDRKEHLSKLRKEWKWSDKVKAKMSRSAQGNQRARRHGLSERVSRKVEALKDVPKTCERCGETKPRSEFYLVGGTKIETAPDPYRSKCKKCSDRHRHRPKESFLFPTD